MTSSALAKDAIKIGLLVMQEGVFTVPGNDLVRLFRMALNEHKTQVAGKKIERVLGPSDPTPDTAVRQARKLSKGSGRHYHRTAFRLRRHRAARLCKDGPEQDHRIPSPAAAWY